MTQLLYINALELNKMMSEKVVKLYDIREIDEFQRDHIKNAKNTPLSKLDVQDFSELTTNDNVVFYCQGGNRTKQCEAKLQLLNVDKVLVLDGGISAWKKHGLSIKENQKAPLPIMRQVQIIAGSLIVLGVILGYSVSPMFFLLSGFVGAGLTFAGISGFCGMANILMLLPYNKKTH